MILNGMSDVLIDKIANKLYARYHQHTDKHSENYEGVVQAIEMDNSVSINPNLNPIKIMIIMYLHNKYKKSNNLAPID